MGQAFISASTLMAAFAYMVAILDIKANEIMCCNDLITACMHKVATLDDQEQLHPHVQIYCIFTASILISACANVVAILDGQLEQLCPHVQIYYMFTASILIFACAHAVAVLDGQLEQLRTHAQIYYMCTASILIFACAHVVAVLDGQHPCTNILYLYSHLLQPTHRVAVLDDRLEQLHTHHTHTMVCPCTNILFLKSPALQIYFW